jgi:hypothetical protein
VVVSNYSGTVQLTSSDAQASFQPAPSLTLTNGTASAQVVFKTAGLQSITATDAPKALTSGSAPITVNPGVAAQLSVSAPLAATIGLPITVTVTAVDTYMNVATSYAGTVHFSLAKPDPQVVLPQDSQLTNGTKSFPGVILGTVGAQTIRAMDTVTTSITGACNSINVVSNAATQFAVTTNPPASVNVRQTFGLTLQALDAAGHLAAGYTGTVHFSSSDTAALLPANSTLANGAGSFSTTLETAGTGSQPLMTTITATDIATSSITGSVSISVTNVPLTISPGAPPNGQVGVNYGPLTTRYFRCSGLPGRRSCVPCTPGPGGTCGNFPPCGRVSIGTCIETQQVFNGFTFRAAGGVPGYSWTASGMPPALTVTATNGEILGTPTSPNTYNITVTVTDSGNPSISTHANYTITISKPNPPVVNTTPPPPPGVVGQQYGGASGFTFSASGYQPQNFTWAETGALPGGLMFSTGGVLSGIPNAPTASPVTITVTATDQFGTPSAGAVFNIVVSAHGFQAAGNMTSARTLHTATLITSGTASGKVLIAGGQVGVSLLASAELFDPATGSFALTTGNMTTSHSAHTATLLTGGTNAGKVLIAGGQTGAIGNATMTAELFDPSAGTFTSTGSMITARYGHTATPLGTTGQVLITGGADATGTALASAEIFDPSTGKFTATAGSMQAARKGHTATLLANGMILVTGGIDAAGSHLASAEIFDPGMGRFTAAKGSMTVTRASHTATLIGGNRTNSGKVLVVGGVDDTGKARNTAELFDPVSQNFTATSPMVAAHANHTATLLNDGTTVLLAGGLDAGGSASPVVEIFDPASGGSFIATGRLVTAREEHTATLLANGHVLATGGSNGSSTLASVEVYQ